MKTNTDTSYTAELAPNPVEVDPVAAVLRLYARRVKGLAPDGLDKLTTDWLTERADDVCSEVAEILADTYGWVALGRGYERDALRTVAEVLDANRARLLRVEMAARSAGGVGVEVGEYAAAD